MRRFALMVVSCLAGVACEPSSSAPPDQASTFTGLWDGSGVMLESLFLDPVVGHPVAGAEARYSQVSVMPGDSGGYEIGGFFPPGIHPILLKDGASLSGRNISTPPIAAPQCAPTPACPSPTDSVTVYEGSARIEDGMLLLVLAGERTLCCWKRNFVAHFIGLPAQ
jgi:hypothetical protein